MENRAHDRRSLLSFYACCFMFMIGVYIVLGCLYQTYDLVSQTAQWSDMLEGLFYQKKNVRVSANDDEMVRYRVNWEPTRTDTELMAEKYVKHDAIIEAEIFDDGRDDFAFAPNYTIHELAKFERITMRIFFNVTNGTMRDRVFLEIIEIEREGIPFSEFHFNSFLPLPLTYRIVDIPIAKKFMKMWIRKPDAEIRFMLKITFGVGSNVTTVAVKHPIMIFSSIEEPPKCDEFACCLTSKFIELEGEQYNDLVLPQSVYEQQCVDCIRAAENIQLHAVDTLNMVIQRRLKASARHSAARSAREMSCKRAVIEDLPYFTPTNCNCVEDAEIIEEQENNATAPMRIMGGEKESNASSSTP